MILWHGNKVEEKLPGHANCGNRERERQSME